MIEIEVRDKSLMMIFLQEECNLACAHCAREDEPMDPGYKLSFAQLRSCLSDCRSLESICRVHFSGGEPTLWTEGNHDLVDLLLEIAKAGFPPSFTTNGSFFLDYGKCRQFFGKYVNGSIMPLRVYLSIDTLHHNFNAKKKRARSLDNVIKCKLELPPAKADLLDITLMAVVSKDPKSLLPDEMVEHYESLGVDFGFVPLLPIGKAKSLSHLCPDFSSDNPEDLGAYARFHKEENQKKWAKTRDQRTTDHIILIGNDYFFFTGQWHKVAQLGRVPNSIKRVYSGSDVGLR